MSNAKEYIENEMSVIEEDFHKTFYTMGGLMKVFKQMLPKFRLLIKATGDSKAVKLANAVSASASSFIIAVHQLDSHFRVGDKEDKEAYRNMHADIAKIIGITLDQIRFERYDQLANLMIDFNQGNYAQVEEHLIDSLLDYEESKTLEGFGLVQRYAPNLTPEQKEEFCRDLVKWRDYSNMIKQ